MKVNKWYAGLAAAAVVAAAGYAFMLLQPRIITVRVYSDYSFRMQHSNWPDLLESRFRDAALIFQRSGAGVKWKVLGSNDTAPTSDMATLDGRRNVLPELGDNKAAVLVSFTGLHEGDRIGSTNPFSRAVMVVDFPDRPESANAIILAGNLAHMFAATSCRSWATTKRQSWSHSPGSTKATASAAPTPSPALSWWSISRTARNRPTPSSWPGTWPICSPQRLAGAGRQQSGSPGLIHRAPRRRPHRQHQPLLPRCHGGRFPGPPGIGQRHHPGREPGPYVRRNVLPELGDNKAAVLVSFTGLHEGDRIGSTNPFSRAVMVVDFPDRPESANAIILAGNLAHMFAATSCRSWATTKRQSWSHSPGSTKATASAAPTPSPALSWWSISRTARNRPTPSSWPG